MSNVDNFMLDRPPIWRQSRNMQTTYVLPDEYHTRNEGNSKPVRTLKPTEAKIQRIFDSINSHHWSLNKAVYFVRCKKKKPHNLGIKNKAQETMKVPTMQFTDVG